MHLTRVQFEVQFDWAAGNVWANGSSQHHCGRQLTRGLTNCFARRLGMIAGGCDTSAIDPARLAAQPADLRALFSAQEAKLEAERRRVMTTHGVLQCRERTGCIQKDRRPSRMP